MGEEEGGGAARALLGGGTGRTGQVAPYEKKRET